MAKTIIVVEIDEGKVTAVEMSGRGGNAELIRYFIRDLPEEGPSSAWLKEQWQQARFSHNPLVWLMPESRIRYQTLLLPVLPEEKLDNAVRMELESHVGRDYQYRIIGRHRHESLEQVRVALIRQADYEQFQTLFEEAGLEVLWAGWRFRGMQNFINFNREFLEQENGPLVYLDLMKERANLGVFQDEDIIFQREFQPGLRGLSTEEPAELEDFIEELRLSKAAVEKEGLTGNLPVRLWGLGRTYQAAQLPELLSQRLGFILQIPSKSRVGGVVTGERTPELAPLIGLGLETIGWPRQEKLRLYSPAQQRRSTYRNLVTVWGVWGLCALILLAGLGLWFQAITVRQEKVDQWLDDKKPRLNELVQIQQETTANLTRIRGLETYQSGQDRELDFLISLQQNLPVGTHISNLILENGAVKDLSGVTPSVSCLLKKLQRIPDLQGLKLKGNISVTDQGELFHLEGPLSPRRGE